MQIETGSIIISPSERARIVALVRQIGACNRLEGETRDEFGCSTLTSERHKADRWAHEDELAKLLGLRSVFDI